MSRLKTFLMYALWVVGFIILSEFLINVGLNSSYHDLTRKDAIEQVKIYQAEATMVNGRVRGLVRNSQPKELSNQYIKIDFYSKRDVFLGRSYVEMNKIEKDATQSFELFFKLEDVGSYKVSIVDQKDPQGELTPMVKELTKSEVIVATIFTFLIFW